MPRTSLAPQLPNPGMRAQHPSQKILYISTFHFGFLKISFSENKLHLALFSQFLKASKETKKMINAAKNQTV